jgi:hypothetical protein
MKVYRYWFLANFLCTKYTKCINIHYFLAVLRIHAIVDPDPDSRIHASGYWIRIRIRILLFLSLTFKTSAKKFFLRSFSAYYFLKVHLHNFLKIKSIKKVTKQ